jgi:hypothetical protein
MRRLLAGRRGLTLDAFAANGFAGVLVRKVRKPFLYALAFQCGSGFDERQNLNVNLAAGVTRRFGGWFRHSRGYPGHFSPLVV